MTIKHIEFCGAEQIHEVEKVWFSPAHIEERESKTGPGRDTVYATEPAEKHPLIFADGTVFVMNSSGKTVSRYDLGASMVPIEVTDAITTNKRPMDEVSSVEIIKHQ